MLGGESVLITVPGSAPPSPRGAGRLPTTCAGSVAKRTSTTSQAAAPMPRARRCPLLAAACAWVMERRTDLEIGMKPMSPWVGAALVVSSSLASCDGDPTWPLAPSPVRDAAGHTGSVTQTIAVVR